MKTSRELRNLGISLLCGLCVFIGAVTAHATTFYVATTGNDSNAGTLTSPFRTIAKGLTVAGPGNTLYIRAGNYAEIITGAQLQNGNSWTDAPVIAGYPGETIRLNPATCTPIISLGLQTTHYVIFKDFIVDGINQPYSLSDLCGAISMGSEGSAIHHIRFQNLEVTNSPGHAIAARGHFNEFLNLHCHQNGRGSMLAGYGPGVNCLYGVTTDSIVRGGTYHDNQCYAIRFADSGKLAPANNNVIDGVMAYANGRNHAFGGTAVCNSGGGGFVLGDQYNTAQNNILYNNWVGIDMFTGGLGFTSHVQIYNNTITTSELGIIVRNSTQSNTVIQNNHVVGNNSNLVDQGTGTIQDHNRTNGAITDCTISLSNFHHKIGSMCIDAGHTINSVKVDFDGLLRPQGPALDIGAFEANGTADPPPNPPINLRVF